MFVTTANSLNMPQPLLDRMEIIRSPATPRTKRSRSPSATSCPSSEGPRAEGRRAGRSDEAIRDLIRYYTREAGVRSLERELGNLRRKAVRDLMRETAIAITVDDERLAKYAASRSTATARRCGGPGRHRHGPGLDRVRRRHPDHRSGQDAGKGRMTVTGNLRR
jgi:ATP-dependent Lon protease